MGSLTYLLKHRGAGLALQLPRGHKLCELKQIAVTEVIIPTCAPTKCLATYIGASRLSGPLADTEGWAESSICGDTEGGNLLCFDLCGEHVGDLPEEDNTHRYVCS